MCHVLVHIHGKSGRTCTQAKLLMARLTYYPLQHAILQYHMGKQTTKTKQSRQHIHESFSQARSSCRKRSLPTGLLSTSINNVMNSRPRERNVALPIFIPSATWHDHHFVMTTGWLEIPPWLRKTTFIFISLSPGFTEPRVLTCFDPPAVPGCSAFFPSKGGTVWFWPAETCRRGLSPKIATRSHDPSLRRKTRCCKPADTWMYVNQPKEECGMYQNCKPQHDHHFREAVFRPSLQKLACISCMTFHHTGVERYILHLCSFHKPRHSHQCVGYSFLQLWNGALSLPIPAESHNVTIASEKHSVHLTCRNLDVGNMSFSKGGISHRQYAFPTVCWTLLKNCGITSDGWPKRESALIFICVSVGHEEIFLMLHPAKSNSTTIVLQKHSVWLCPPESIAQCK